ncbi:TPA: hypothetical protein N0F65_012060 [Lagenidium giganteum]|uniref:glucan endo-1,3-beta-D-glucosidase n=1 Tax=Lagenidium giganteum TaxID=4803 RepID=A0AAV2YC36_9STRA|nr:TPA: hypothetical protein N0F65_012060 [Lagenidium giganteum]
MAVNEGSPLLRAADGTARSHTNARGRVLRRVAYAGVSLVLVVLLGVWALRPHGSDGATKATVASAPTDVAPPAHVTPHSPPMLRTEDEPASNGTTGVPKDATTTANVSDAELLRMLPPFSGHLHPISPKLIDRSKFPHALPTNAFWTNLMVGDDHGLNAGAGQITLSPYTVRSLPKRLEVSYGDSRRVATAKDITEYFNVDVSFTAYGQQTDGSNTTLLLGDGNSTSREVVGFDPLSVTVQYSFDNASTDDSTKTMHALLVRGSPYVTVEYKNVIQVVEFNSTILRVNGEAVEDVGALIGSKQQWTSARFELDIEVYGAAQGSVQQKWLLYFAEPRTLRLQVANEKDYRPYNLRGELTTPTNMRLVDRDFYSGVARLAIVPLGAETPVTDTLDAHAMVYPIGSSIKSDVVDDLGRVSFCWKTKSAGNESALLMLANPHHVNTLSKDSQEDKEFKLLQQFGHRTLKSNMTAVVGACWTMEDNLPAVGFEVNASAVKPEHVAAIKDALVLDANYTPEALDPYYFGKELARQARLVLIADTIGEKKIRDTILKAMERWVRPWLIGENEDHFNYDQSWGGLCSRNGLKGVFWMTDFGNGWYNDHHFHYGYLIYSLAVIGKYRPSFVKAHRASILSIVRDIASPNIDDPYFPFARHFSWFDGHSFASGVYTLEGGKSQESVSEAINAYYGVYLLGKVLDVESVRNLGHLLVAQEIRAAQTYWQMSSQSEIYEPIYAKNKMTGQVACTKVSYTTWFGPQVEHMHLINMIPFTPITPAFIKPEYVQEEYPVLLEEAFNRTVDPIDKRWKGYAYLDLAIINPEEAWQLVTTDLDFFDDGNSKTNSLFWIATRPIKA